MICARTVLTLTAVAALSVPVVAGAAARSNPNAYGATLQYLQQSCVGGRAGEAAAARSGCTSLNPFTVVMTVIAPGRYRLDVTNQRSGGNYRYFAWLLADGMTLKRVVGTNGGSCGTSSGIISCTRKLAARGCGCAQRDLIVNFTASGREPTRAKGGYWIHYGLVTPYLDVPTTFNDVPICSPGEKSTSVHPCLK